MDDLKNIYTKVFLRSIDQTISVDQLNHVKHKWWYNVRHKAIGGLRLTDEGLKVVQEQAKIKTYTIDFPKEFAFTPQVLIWLDNFIDGPYFISRKNITVTKEKAAFELYLFSGDIRKMGHGKAMAKRLSQE